MKPDGTLAEQVGRRLRWLRKHNTGLSQKSLAEEVGVSPGMISAIERGKRLPTLEMLALIGQRLFIEYKPWEILDRFFRESPDLEDLR